jgi:hypothetical protein
VISVSIQSVRVNAIEPRDENWVPCCYRQDSGTSWDLRTGQMRRKDMTGGARGYGYSEIFGTGWSRMVIYATKAQH